MNIIIPSVVINDGILPFMVMTPFKTPTKSAIISTRSKLRKGFTPWFESKANKTEDIPKTEPTERSNSPDIMSIPTPTTTIPTSVEVVSTTARLDAVRNKLGAAIAKNMKTTIRPSAGGVREYLIVLMTNDAFLR
jgi:hypothetical protein